MEQFAVRGEALHPVVAPVGHQHAAVELVDRDTPRVVELARLRSLLAEAPDVLAVQGELLHERTAGTDDPQRAVRLPLDAPGGVQLARSVTGFAPVVGHRAGRVQRHHLVGVFIGEEKGPVPVGIATDRSGKGLFVPLVVLPVDGQVDIGIEHPFEVELGEPDPFEQGGLGVGLVQDVVPAIASEREVEGAVQAVHEGPLAHGGHENVAHAQQVRIGCFRCFGGKYLSNH